MQRKAVEDAKADMQRLLVRIDEMERCAGWNRYTSEGNQNKGKPHPDDTFEGGEFVAAVKRASLDVQKSMTRMRNS